MKNPPKEIGVPMSQAEITQHFKDHGWEDRLQTLKPEEHFKKPCNPIYGFPPGTMHIGTKYRDLNSLLMADIFQYVTTDGKLLPKGEVIAKGLRIDGIWRYVPAPPAR
jgi:hypothetical protein